jgi:hypothetical protein
MLLAKYFFTKAKTGNRVSKLKITGYEKERGSRCSQKKRQEEKYPKQLRESLLRLLPKATFICGYEMNWVKSTWMRTFPTSSVIEDNRDGVLGD